MNAAHFSRDEIDAGLAYCRWLHGKAFNDWLNEGRKAMGQPLSPTPVLLNDRGKRVYEKLLRQINSEQRGGAVPLLENQRKLVLQRLCELKDGKPVGAVSAGARAPVKHATLRLSSITKFVGSGKRIIRGLANSGQLDRVGDIVEPKGGQWTLPVPLLWQHKHDQPIGWVREIEARSDGLWITAELAEGIGQADQAWRMIEAGLVDSYSIGFQSKEWSPLPGGGQRFTAWTLMEVSVVTIPADPGAKIRRSHRADRRTPVEGVPLIPASSGSVRLLSGGGKRGGSVSLRKY